MRAAIAALLTALPFAAVAQEDANSREAMMTALAMNGCAVTEAQTAEIFGAQGFDPEFVRHELGQMVLDETAFLEAGYVLRVKAPHCPPADPVPTPAQTFRQAIVENGCSITDAEARALDIEAARMRPAVLSWIDAGEAEVDGRTLTLQGCE